MAYFPKAIIYVGEQKFEYYHQIEIESTWRNLGDKCTIKLPNLRQMLDAGFVSGNKVEIYGGYETENQQLPLLFKGYVNEVIPKIPFTLECEDQLYQLKRNKVEKKAFRNTDLNQLLEYITNGLQVKFGDLPEISFAQFRIDKKHNTTAKSLQKLKDSYGLVAYFRTDGSLFVGLPYTEDTTNLKANTAKFNFQKNVIGHCDLVYKKAEDVKIKAKVVNFLKNNQKIEFEIGDEDGEQRTIFLRSETTDKSQLEKIAKAELKKYKYEGYRGKFSAFGIPRIIQNGTVELEDELYPERAGNYLVDKVETKFTAGSQVGIRQHIHLGKKV